MWRLRIGAAAKDDHHLFSTNNYVGRQTWEFDAEAGSPAEFAGMEQARRNFSLNRSRFKTSGDLLWRIQIQYPRGRLENYGYVYIMESGNFQDLVPSSVSSWVYS
ncbi:hypothetical protein F2Q68_00017135 [Brassica cretica]|uniref:Squalene cyclase N-terminal domain-containing protein n=1 Tax=Brassica cretica TaxID=69181 RepID=A0A8S9HP77_BRACR|nr:hypothetical protein F2Q68_00017135 [Brassica cretica]